MTEGTTLSTATKAIIALAIILVALAVILWPYTSELLGRLRNIIGDIGSHAG